MRTSVKTGKREKKTFQGGSFIIIYNRECTPAWNMSGRKVLIREARDNSLKMGEMNFVQISFNNFLRKACKKALTETEKNFLQISFKNFRRKACKKAWLKPNHSFSDRCYISPTGIGLLCYMRSPLCIVTCILCYSRLLCARMLWHIKTSPLTLIGWHWVVDWP